MTSTTLIVASDRYGAENASLDFERGIAGEYPDLDAEVIGEPCPTEAELIDAGQRADALLLSTRDAVTPSLVAAIPRVKVIARYGVGLDNVDLDAAAEAGIVVTHYPQYCTDEVADHAVTLLLSLNRRIVQLDRAMHLGAWNSAGAFTRTMLTGPVPALRTQTIGIIGFGRIGQSSARKLKAFGSRILVHDPYLSTETIADQGYLPVSLDDLMSQADLVTVHCPLTPETRGFIDGRLLALAKPTLGLVNTARGPIVSQDALIEFLEGNPQAQAALDVMEIEPLPADSPLYRVPNLVLTPHAAYYSEQSVATVREQTFRSALAVLRGVAPPTIANPRVLERVHLRAE